MKYTIHAFAGDEIKERYKISVQAVSAAHAIDQAKKVMEYAGERPNTLFYAIWQREPKIKFYPIAKP